MECPECGRDDFGPGSHAGSCSRWEPPLAPVVEGRAAPGCRYPYCSCVECPALDYDDE